MATKLPWFKFYPADWLRDTRILPPEARALWMDFLSLMHDSSRRGYLINRTGKPYTPDQLAGICGCSADAVSRVTQVLIDSGVASCTDTGILYSRRMVRDEHKRTLCSRAGKTGGGNPKLGTFKGTSKGTSKGTPKHPSDSDIFPSSPGKGGAGGKPDPPGFERFWSAYPRKSDRQDAAQVWYELAPDEALVGIILAAVERQKRSDQWRRGVIPNPDNWLAKRRWEDEVPLTLVSPPEKTDEERRAETLRQRAEAERKKLAAGGGA